jgi:hypothetical protein
MRGHNGSDPSFYYNSIELAKCLTVVEIEISIMSTTNHKAIGPNSVLREAYKYATKHQKKVLRKVMSFCFVSST